MLAQEMADGKNKQDQLEKFNLEERTAKFGEDVISFCLNLPKNEITKPLITQLVKAATSIGANYCEADNAESKKDFKHKIAISKKEAKESKHFLRMVGQAVSQEKNEAQKLWTEAKELTLIFNSIYNKVK
ncbi:MAG: four helix bundle protein [Patescibacteria group bacterium]